MCIAISKDQDLLISKETLQQCFNANPDGAGFMYSENKQLHVQKGFFTFDEFYNAYKPHETKRAVLHFRIKTHGTISENNCHPFHIHKGLGFVHNGIISGFGKQDDSDTAEFNTEVLKPLVEKWGNLALFQPAVKSLVEHRIGYSKLIFLDRHGNVEIFNESKGVWDEGIWYSNSSYLKPKPIERTPWKSPVEPPKYYNGRYDSTSKLLPVETKKPSEVVKIGDIVSLTANYYDTATERKYLVGDVFEVVAVNNNFSVDLMLDDINEPIQFIYNIPYRILEFWNTDFNNPYDNGYYGSYYKERDL